MSKAFKFSRETPEHKYLLNEFAAPFFKGHLWQSASQFIAYTMLNTKGMDKKQAHANNALREKILGAYDPFKCHYFLTNKGLIANNAILRLDAEEVESKIIRQAVEAKFGQNPMLLHLLLKVEEEKIVYDNPYDATLGNGRDGKGKNLLGKNLVRFRDKIANEYSLDGAAPTVVFDISAAYCEHILVGDV